MWAPANRVCRLLFERLVKYHPALDLFFRKLVGTFFGMLNDEFSKGSMTMLDAADGERSVTGPL